MSNPARVLAGLLLLLCIRAVGGEWKAVSIPTQEGFPGSGIVWLRCFIRVPDNMVTPAEKDLWRDSITLSIGGLRGSFSVFLNGQRIAEGASIPEGQRRRFKVPKGILEKQRFNVLALRLAEDAARAGVREPPILAGYFDELPLSGDWEWQAIEPDPPALAAAATQPASAYYTEAGFRQSSTPLSANPEPIPGERLLPVEALNKIQPASDLVVDLVASEPDVAQPTHISFDERGRMWVSQYRQYPYPAGLKMISRDKYYRGHYDRVPPPPPHQDRGRDIITVHEDTDGDGKFDRVRTVLDGLNMANAAVRGHGGIWVMNTPYLLYYPDANGDDVPDRDPEVRLAGFGLEDAHSVANGLIWGPDGWLYGAQGSTTTSRVVRPGVDPPGFAGIYHEGCMVWRYHPETKEYEIFAEGGGNVFELDFDDEGRLFSGHNGGDTRGWHYIPGGVFLKQGLDPGKFGPSANTFAFGQLDMMKSRNPISRFTHATILSGGTALPSQYLGKILAADPLHRNIVMAERYPQGSTFETADSGIPLASADPAFRPVFITNGADGAIYVADFCEEFIAHGQHYQGQIDPDSGRIYRIRGKGIPLEKDLNLAAKTNRELVDLLHHPNRWHRHTAVRLLGERHDPNTYSLLREALHSHEEHPALEAIWALYQSGGLDDSVAREGLYHPIAAVRAWTIRLMGDRRKLSKEFYDAVLGLVATEPDPEVRCQIASTARRLLSTQALGLVSALLRRDQDAEDRYIPMMCWWTLESHCAMAPDAVIAAVPWDSVMARQTILSRLMRRFAASGGRNDLLVCARLLDAAPTADHRRLLMSGFEESIKGRALPPLPDELVESLDRSGVASTHLRVRLKEPAAVAEAIKVAGNPEAKLEERMLCLRLFGEVKIAESVPVLLRLVEQEKNVEVRKAALGALLLYDDPSIGERMAALYSNLPAELQAGALAVLTSRPAWSLLVLKLVESGSIPRPQVSEDVAARLRENDDQTIAELAKRLLPEAAKPTSAEKRALIERVRGVVAAGSGDPYKGEPIFQQRCSVCHTLFFKGGKIGPDLTPYQRDDLSTLLTSVLDPNAEIREGYQNQIVITKDGRTLSGVVASSDASSLILRGMDGSEISVPRGEVREARPTGVSLMPDGILQGLSDQEIRDFFAYLRISQPIMR